MITIIRPFLLLFLSSVVVTILSTSLLPGIHGFLLLEKKTTILSSSSSLYYYRHSPSSSSSASFQQRRQLLPLEGVVNGDGSNADDNASKTKTTTTTTTLSPTTEYDQKQEEVRRQMLKIRLESASSSSASTASDVRGKVLLVVEDDDDDDDESSLATMDEFALSSEADGELCVLPIFDYEQYDNDTLEKFQRIQNESRFFDQLINLLIPTLIPVVAYLSYENVAAFANHLTDLLSSRTWDEVDGGSYRTSIIAPAINGVIMPACVVSFATLLSVTISSLRQRQQEIRTSIIQEAGELRVLQSLVDAYPDGQIKNQCRSYLIEYTSRLISESKPRIKTSTLETEFETLDVERGYDTEMNGFFNQLIKLDNVRDDLRSESYAAIARLNAQRSTRISSLQSSFPPLHYATLIVLALSVMSCFLLETDQDILIFLNAVQLKLLWSMLVGVFSGFAVVCYDLIEPFQGSYQISKSVDQLYIIRSTLMASVCNTKVETYDGI